MIGENTVTLKTRRWQGEAPLIGDYLSAGGKARYAYRVIDVRRVRSRQGRADSYAFGCARETIAPPFARVHRWVWERRRPQRESGNPESPTLFTQTGGLQPTLD